MKLGKSGIKSAVLAILFFAFLLSGLRAQPVLDSEDKVLPSETKSNVNSSELFERIADTSNTVKDLSAAVNLHLLLNNTLNFSLDGTFYYKQPDKIKLQLDGTPEFLAARQDQGFKTAQVLSSLRRDITKDYDARIVSETQMEGIPCYAISLVPKENADVSKILVWVDAKHYTLPQLILSYKDGSTVTQRKHYVKIGDIYVVGSMETDYVANNISAEIDASFKNYKVNLGIPDAVFAGSSRKSTPVTAF